MCRRPFNCLIVLGAVIAYFVIFPADFGFVHQLLALTQSVATGAWGLLIALVLVAGAIRIWGPRAAANTERSGPQ